MRQAAGVHGCLVRILLMGHMPLFGSYAQLADLHAVLIGNSVCVHSCTSAEHVALCRLKPSYQPAHLKT